MDGARQNTGRRIWIGHWVPDSDTACTNQAGDPLSPSARRELRLRRGQLRPRFRKRNSEVLRWMSVR